VAVAVGERDEHVEGVSRKREKILRLGTVTPSSRHAGIIPIVAIANNVIVWRTPGTENA
jgi:hypothetical protein